MRGVTLLVAVILSSVVLSVALALLDVAYKQQLLASTAKQSQYAFYNADTVMECALYWDQRQNAFDYTSPLDPNPDAQGNSQNIKCNNLGIRSYSSPAPGTTRTTTFTLPCAGGGSVGTATIVKTDGVALCAPKSHSCLYATGYSSCPATDPRRIERGLKVLY